MYTTCSPHVLQKEEIMTSITVTNQLEKVVGTLISLILCLTYVHSDNWESAMRTSRMFWQKLFRWGVQSKLLLVWWQRYVYYCILNLLSTWENLWNQWNDNLIFVLLNRYLFWNRSCASSFIISTLEGFNFQFLLQQIPTQQIDLSILSVPTTFLSGGTILQPPITF